MRIPNLMHGAFFMLGAYFGVTLLAKGVNFWLAALVSAAAMAVIGGLIERFLLRRLEGQVLPQVLLTLGFAFIIADVCLMIWTGDPWQPATPRSSARRGAGDGPVLPALSAGDRRGRGGGRHRAVAHGRLDAARRHDPRRRRRSADRARRRHQGVAAVHAGLRLGAALAAFAGVMGAPYLSVYPGLDFEMLPLALIVVILGGTGSLLGALVGSFLIGFLYNFGQAMFPDLAYVILFLPMLLVLVLRPQGLFGRVVP